MDPRTRALIMGAAGGATAEKIYVEDVFSTWLYTGNGSTQTITNGIDLASKGGAVWTKPRSEATDHSIVDSAHGLDRFVVPSSAGEEGFQTSWTFNSTGYSIPDANSYVNTSSTAYVSWTFRKAAKFFDVVSYTGNGSSRTISHSLGSVPGCILVKRTDVAGNWQVYHRSASATHYLVLNSTAARVASSTRWNDTTPTSTEFSLGTDATVNANGGTYIAYLFAHDAGGFGDTGNDNVISCGSFTTSSGGSVEVTLGWEPQWVMVKARTTTSDWMIFDTMRGYAIGSIARLRANLANAEEAPGNYGNLEVDGFTVDNLGNTISYIYIAIRRGPMKKPTDATKVFQPKVYTGTNVDNRLVTTDIVTDMAWVRQRNDTVLGGMVVGDRLRGQPYLLTGTTAAEVNDGDSFDQEIVSSIEYGNAFTSMTGFWVGNDATSKLNANTTSNNHLAYAFRRSAGFFDAVLFIASGSAKTIKHNLTVEPELILVKQKSAIADWQIYSQPTGASAYLTFTTAEVVTSNTDRWNATSPTSSLFSIGTAFSADYYIAYLFASCPGVSKVGTYTGTGTTLNIDCGFTNGARFVMIKATQSTYDWFVWDTARGIVSGNDPYLRLSSTGSEVTSTDYIDPLSSGFQISSTAPLAINQDGFNYIYLAIA
jgi:hypothetical protein